MADTDQKSEVGLRPATAADQPTITAIIHAANINPLGLNWERFLLAEVDGQIVGTGQIKPHGDGSLELASIAVIPTWQGEGIGSLIIHTLIDQHTQSSNAPLYLTCEGRLESYYDRFGFRRIGRAEMPPYFRRIARIAGIFIGLGRIFHPNNRMYLVVMCLDSNPPSNLAAHP